MAEHVREALRSVTDPEIGINIVDLGLIYDIEVGPGELVIRMTMTAPACPMGAWLTGQVRQEAQRIAGARSVTVDVVWDPPWNPSMMSDAARDRLGWPEDAS